MSTAITLPLALGDRPRPQPRLPGRVDLLHGPAAAVGGRVDRGRHLLAAHLRHEPRDRERRARSASGSSTSRSTGWPEHGAVRRHRARRPVVAVRPAARGPAARRPEDDPARRSTGRPRWTARPPGRRFRFITLPAIKNTLIVVGVLQVIIGLQVFDLLYSLTSGGPGRDTYVLIMAIYDDHVRADQPGLRRRDHGPPVRDHRRGELPDPDRAGPPAARRSPSSTRRPRRPPRPARTSLRLDAGSAMAIRASSAQAARGRSAEADPAASDR